MTASNNILNPREWTSRYADDLFRYAMSKTGKADLAEDLVQEAFLGALKALESFRGQSSERTWLFAILKFKIADHYRKASTKHEITNSSFSQEQEMYADNYFNEKGEWNESAVPTPWGVDYSYSVENKELAAALNKCIDKLPASQKELVLLKLVEEQETATICSELKITQTNYWVILHRAKLQLRACLEKNWFKA